MKIHMIIRILTTICLLSIVWQNAHWSVALVLTLQAITIEVSAVIHIMQLNILKEK